MADSQAYDYICYFTGGNTPTQGAIEIRGESQDSALSGNNAFELSEFNVKGENSTAIGSSTTGAGGAGKCKFERLTMKKLTDAATCSLYKAMILGAHFEEVVLELRRSGATFMRFKFKMCIIAEMETTASGDDESEDSFVVDWGAINVEYFAQDASGDIAAGPTDEIPFSRVTNASEYEVTSL
ncbi:MAG: type VI secretion system tube protein Hcp [Pseudomonadota bacterium]